jgi:hypothetical protein
MYTLHHINVLISRTFSVRTRQRHCSFYLASMVSISTDYSIHHARYKIVHLGLRRCCMSSRAKRSTSAYVDLGDTSYIFRAVYCARYQTTIACNCTSPTSSVLHGIRQPGCPVCKHKHASIPLSLGSSKQTAGLPYMYATLSGECLLF